jgi:recombinase-like zinc beta ribbon protein
MERKSLRLTGGRLSGRPPKTATKNLLAGLATCAACGGGMVVETSPRRRGRVPEYHCYRAKHTAVCTNKRHIPVSEMNEAVLQAFEQHVFTPERIEHVIQLSERNDEREQHESLEREQRDIEKRITRVLVAGPARHRSKVGQELSVRHRVLPEHVLRENRCCSLSSKVIFRGGRQPGGPLSFRRQRDIRPDAALLIGRRQVLYPSKLVAEQWHGCNVHPC